MERGATLRWLDEQSPISATWRGERRFAGSTNKVRFPPHVSGGWRSRYNRGREVGLKTLWLHLGTPKTGTTALQHFLSSNADALSSHGVAYPTMPFSYRFIPPARNAHFIIAPEKRDACGDDSGHEEELVERALDVVTGAFETHDTVILSDESLWFIAPRIAKFMRPVMERADAEGWTVRAIAWLRKQDDMAQSVWMQQAKNPMRYPAVSWERWREKQYINLDYARTLGFFADIIGAENITVRTYEKSALAESGGIVGDFMSAVGLEQWADLSMETDSMNTSSISLNIAAILHEFKSSPYWKERKPNPFMNAAFHCTRRSEAPAMSLFSAESSREFLGHFQECNDTVAREYLHRDGPLFEDTPPKGIAWEPDNEWMLTDLKNYCRAVNRRIEQVGAKGEAAGSEGAAGSGAGEARVLDAVLGVAEEEKPPTDAHLAAARHLGDFFCMRLAQIEAGCRPAPLSDMSVNMLVESLVISEGTDTVARCNNARLRAEVARLRAERRDTPVRKLARSVRNALRRAKRKLQGETDS